MTDRPLIIFREGQLWKDHGGHYYPASRFSVVMTRETFLTRPGPDAERYAKECQKALNQYEEAQRAAMEEAK